VSRRAALVTGGSAGIGLAIAEALVAEGYAVTIAARRPDRLEAAAEALRAAGGAVRAVAANVAKADDIDRLIDEHRRAFGRTDVLVNNAGLGLSNAIEHASTEKLDLQLDVNLRAAYLMLRGCIPMLRDAGAEHGKALVVNVSSIFGRLPQPHVAAYAATKAGLIALSHSAHGELSTAGIQVTALCPAWVDTPGTDWVTGVEKAAMIRASDVAEAVRFLLRTSPQCIVPDLTMVGPGTNLFAPGGGAG
jgi:NAD(P)-dependent dehydrogenase (short-subunit alcohol dehydrogenase family)